MQIKYINKWIILFIMIQLFGLIIYYLEINFFELKNFIAGDEEYYQNPYFEGKSLFYAKLAQIGSFTEFKEVPRIIQILLFSYIITKQLKISNFILLCLFSIASLFFLIILVRDVIILCAILIITNYFSNKNKSNLILFSIALIIFYNIAPDIFFLYIATVIFVRKYDGTKFFKYITLLIVVFITFFFRENIIYLIKLNVIEGARNGGETLEFSFEGVLKAILKFYIGPGFIRIYYSDIYFQEFYPISYRISYAAYCLLMYSTILYTISYINIKKLIIVFKEKNEFRINTIFAIVFSLVYILSDSGSSGYRKRYIVFFLLFSSLYANRKFIYDKTGNMKSFIVAFFLILIINIYSI